MSPEIVTIDTCPSKLGSSHSRTSPSLMDLAEDMTISSRLLPCKIPARILIPGCCNFQDYGWCRTGDKCRYSSTAQSTSHYMNLAQSTPHYMNSACIAPATPAKRVNVADGMFRWFLNLLNRLNYMTNTQSFLAKVRSQNPPKQCVEAGPGPRKRQPLSNVLIESRASLSGVGMQRSCTRAQEVAAFSFKSVRFL